MREEQVVTVEWSYPDRKWWDFLGKAEDERCRQHVKSLENKYMMKANEKDQRKKRKAVL